MTSARGVARTAITLLREDEVLHASARTIGVASTRAALATPRSSWLLRSEPTDSGSVASPGRTTT